MNEKTEGKDAKKKAGWKPDENITMIIRKGDDWKPDKRLTMKVREGLIEKKKDTQE